MTKKYVCLRILCDQNEKLEFTLYTFFTGLLIRKAGERIRIRVFIPAPGQVVVVLHKHTHLFL